MEMTKTSPELDQELLSKQPNVPRTFGSWIKPLTVFVGFLVLVLIVTVVSSSVSFKTVSQTPSAAVDLSASAQSIPSGFKWVHPGVELTSERIKLLQQLYKNGTWPLNYSTQQILKQVSLNLNYMTVPSKRNVLKPTPPAVNVSTNAPGATAMNDMGLPV